MFNFFKREAQSGIGTIDMIESMFDKDISKAIEIERSILDRLATAFDDGMDKTRTEVSRLEADIASFKAEIKNLEARISDHEEKLRQAVGADAILKRGQADLVALSDPQPAKFEPAPVSLAAE
jgi:outer membrane protein TolC